MAARPPGATNRETATPEREPEHVSEHVENLRYVARQPILDLHGRVHAYELLFRAGRESAFSGDGDLATRIMLDNTVIFGLEKLTGGLPAFINCTKEALVDELVHVLPPDTTVLEILETLEPTPALIHACRKLKALGFRLALDDFIWKPELEPLVEIADYIKIDFTVTGPEERHAILEKLHKTKAALLAEKVETQADFTQACSEGFKLIQGYYFCRPLLMENRPIPANRLSQIEILRKMRDDTVDMRELSRLVKRDASLTYRLLRLINSPIYALRQEVSSVETALVVVGQDVFRRLATLAIAGELNAGQPTEILRMACLRAQFCELTAGLCGLDATEQYLLGLLSLLPAMLLLPMNELTPSLPLRDQIRKALQGAPVPERCMLEWLIGHEQGRWDACDAIVKAHGLNEQELLRCYDKALSWAEETLRFL